MNAKCIALNVRNCKELYEDMFMTFSHRQFEMLSMQENKCFFEISQESQWPDYNYILMKK